MSRFHQVSEQRKARSRKDFPNESALTQLHALNTLENAIDKDYYLYRLKMVERKEDVMAHAYTGRPQRFRGLAPSINTVLAHAAWWVAFGFSAAIVLGFVG